MKILALRKISIEFCVRFIISGINLRISGEFNEVECDNKTKQCCLTSVKTMLQDVQKKETRMDSTTFSKIGLIVLSGCVWNLVTKGCVSQFSGDTL